MDDIIARLGVEAECSSALAELAEIELTHEQAVMLRFNGAIPLLANLLADVSKDNRKNAAKTMRQMAYNDHPCKIPFLKRACVKKAAALVSEPDPEQQYWGLRVLHALIRGGDWTTTTENAWKYPSCEECFKIGAVGQAFRCLNTDPEYDLRAFASTLFLGILTDAMCYRERLRDMGIVPLLIALTSVKNVNVVEGAMISISNLAGSESMTTTFKEQDIISICQKILDRQPEADEDMQLTKLLAVTTVSLVYGGEEKNEQAQELLEKHDAANFIVRAFDTILSGHSTFMGLDWELSEILLITQSLSRSENNATIMGNAGIADLLVQVLQDESKEDLHLLATRTLLNLSIIPDVKAKLFEAEVTETLKGFTESADLRMADAAKGFLLNMGQLQDSQAVLASQAVLGDDRDIDMEFDVFLSHKRVDARDFARALYNLLIVRGFKTFLDFEYREELKYLGDIVGHSINFIFILTDNIFDSSWCLDELISAVKHNVNIILVVKEGSRWKDEEGNKTCQFPPNHLISTLPEEVQPIFSRKSIAHSDEYYQAFVDTLMKKLKKPDPPQEAVVQPPPQSQAPAPSAPPAGRSLATSSSAANLAQTPIASSANLPPYQQEQPQQAAPVASMHHPMTMPAGQPAAWNQPSMGLNGSSSFQPYHHHAQALAAPPFGMYNNGNGIPLPPSMMMMMPAASQSDGGSQQVMALQRDILQDLQALRKDVVHDVGDVVKMRHKLASQDILVMQKAIDNLQLEVKQARQEFQAGLREMRQIWSSIIPMVSQAGNYSTAGAGSSGSSLFPMVRQASTGAGSSGSYMHRFGSASHRDHGAGHLNSNAFLDNEIPSPLRSFHSESDIGGVLPRGPPVVSHHQRRNLPLMDDQQFRTQQQQQAGSRPLNQQEQMSTNPTKRRGGQQQGSPSGGNSHHFGGPGRGFP